MADIIKPDQKYKTWGYFDNDTFTVSHPKEWEAYISAPNYRAKTVAKGALKEIIKGMLELPATASIDFQRFGGRWRVDENLVPPKAKKRSTDLTELFKKKTRAKI